MAFGTDDFEQGAAEAFHKLAQRLENVHPVRSVSVELPPVSDDLKQELIAQLQVASVSTKTAIYCIDLPDADPKQAHDALTLARNSRVDERCYSRILPLPDVPAKTIYVGSSRNLQKQLLEHLGYGAKKTYSLHMHYWAQHLGRISIDIRFYESALDHDLLCALEDHWATRRIPLFGKRGSV